MNDHIDLTINRDFSRFNKRNTQIGILSVSKKLTNPEDELILTGNANERTCKRMQLDFSCASKSCDCCGETSPLKFIMNKSLCDRCYKKMKSSIDKIWWR